jgi:hypothetical protein
MYQAGLAVLCINVTPETSAAGVHPRRPGTSARPGEGAGRGKPSPGLPGQAPARLPGQAPARLPGQAPARLPGQAAKVPRRSIRSAVDAAGGSPGTVDAGLGPPSRPRPAVG